MSETNEKKQAPTGSGGGKAKKAPMPWQLRAVRWVYPKLEWLLPSLAHRWAIKLFLSPLRYPVPAQEQGWERQAVVTKMAVSGKQITVYTWGAGAKTVLMVHGWSGRGTQMGKFALAFVEKGYRVVAFDAPSHHRSEGKQTNLFEFQDAILALANQLGPIHLLVGHSLGGVACFHAIKHGLEVPKLVTISSPSIANNLLADFAEKLNGSAKTGHFIEMYFRDKLAVDFHAMSGQEVVKSIKVGQYLIIHDHDDGDVSMADAHALRKGYPTAEWMATHKLGHTRILRDSGVVGRTVEFAESLPQKNTLLV